MSSAVDICNIALAGLGVADQIVSLTQDSTNARVCNLLFSHVRDTELRAHPWNFAIKRAQLAATTAPIFGRTSSFPLPSDFLRLLPKDPLDNLATLDWQIESQDGALVIVTDEETLLEIRYIAQITDPNLFDSSFEEVIVAAMRIALCEKVTGGSNTKMQVQEARYKQAILSAKRANAFENVPQVPPDSSWLTCRY